MGGRTRNSTPPAPPAADRTPDQIAALTTALAALWPDAVVELDHTNAYQLIVATILSAQSTDRMINTVTPALFARYPDAAALAVANPDELEVLIHSTGFFRAKARNLIGMAQAVVRDHGGEIPRTMEALIALPGVARKTANVVLGCALGIEAGVIVDTHVTRLAGRLGLSGEHDAVKIELDLMRQLPQAEWTRTANRLIWHGRRVCHAKAPTCDACALAPQCPSFPITPPPKPAKPAAKPKARA